MNIDRISKNQIKFIQSLKLKKYRQKYNKFIVEGHKMVSELQIQSPKSIEVIVARENYLQSHSILYGSPFICNQKEMDQMSQLKSGSEVLAVVYMDQQFEIKKTATSGRFLYVHELNDPGNGGTIFRLADWFGYDGVFLSPESVDVFNHKFVQSSMGSIFRIPYAYKSLGDIQRDYPLPLIASALDGELLNEFDFPEDFILLMGNESRGLPTEIVEQCAHTLLIDNQHSQGAESLNVAVSTGILLFQSRK